MRGRGGGSGVTRVGGMYFGAAAPPAAATSPPTAPLLGAVALAWKGGSAFGWASSLGGEMLAG